MNQRKSNIELLRIIAVFEVMILHLNLPNSGGGFQYVAPESLNRCVLIGFESISINAVNVFILITGYFMAKKNTYKLSKSIELLVDVAVLSGGSYIVNVLFHIYSFSKTDLVKAIIPNNYYVIFYITVCLLSPFCNVIFKHISKENALTFILLLITVFSVYPTLIDIASDIMNTKLRDLSTISRTGSEYGYTIVNFFMMYSIGAFISIYMDISAINLNRKKVLLLYIVSSSLIFIWTFTECFQKEFELGTSLSYCNPLIVGQAVSLFLFFLSIDIKYSKIINSIARGTFTTFLISTGFYKFFSISEIVNLSIPLMILWYVFILISVYICCFMIHIIWNAVKKPIIKKIDKKLKNAVIMISQEGVEHESKY